jgi:hypothetical protein
MKQFKFGIVTPSYAPDFKKCQILCWSIDKFITSSFNHYIVVDSQDYQLFSQLKRTNRKIITKESILPWWIKRIPFFSKKNFWFSCKTLPLRGWLIQQIIKLSAAQYTNEEIIVFIDSDVGFIRPFDLQNFVNKDEVRLFKVTHKNNTSNPIEWDHSTSNLIGIPKINPANNYVGQVITWKRDNLLSLYQHIEKTTGQKWLEALCTSFHLSEYHLYGNFVDYILNDASGHYYDDSHICHQYWDDIPMSEQQLQRFFQKIPSTCISVMISAKAGMSISQDKYLSLLDLVPQNS